MQISIVTGNPKPQSRTKVVAEAVAQRIAHATGAEIARSIDLADYAGGLFTWPHEALATVNQQVAASDYAVVASPTYKAAYTGLLKAFLDRFGDKALAGVTVVPVMTGGSAAHSMVIDTSLRPVLVELGASVPTAGLYFEISQFETLDSVVDSWADRYSRFLGRSDHAAPPEVP